MIRPVEPFSVDQYRAALLAISDRLSDVQVRMLEAQYAAPKRMVTAPDLARLVGHTSYSTVNLHYGKIGKLVADILQASPPEREPGQGRWWPFLSAGMDDPDGFRWIMHPQLAEAIKSLEWIHGADVGSPFELDVPTHGTFPEGAVRKVTVNAYERSREAREQCIAYYGAICFICGFDFEARYGEVGHGYIHVHHEVLLSSAGPTYRVDPVEDLKPVCPNCHAIIHRYSRPFSVDRVKAMIDNSGC